ncbi:EpsG family protein [Escherichia coli]|jgi:hypothetical protein|uniref:EpsG family protein n=2 Tax=Escherichia coli TaxID=562 RepID=UPI000DA56DB1|nr:EpsG family protein [Escherichia coli]AZU84285.1 EpsG family protein [Escherichia coli]EFB6130226.1 EpsG family protein [Escherichia coli]EGF7437636.1 EpsG family protein [Escherichia coli]EGJ2714455.1 EpsG family protein [Escherichia coli]EGJ4588883.1 EpsG family protein [Escherichia coli]
MLFLLLNIVLFISSLTNDKIIFRSSFIFTAVVCSISFGRGYDWINYYDVYTNIDDYLYNFPFEPGYFYVLRFFNWLNVNYPIQNGITTLFLFFCIYSFAKKTNYPSLTFFTIFCFMGHYVLSEQIRQALAICIILLFFDVFRHRKIIKGTLVIFLAMSFHVSAMFCFIYFFMLNDRTRQPNTKFFIVCFIFILMAYSIWLNPNIISFLPLIYKKFVGYTEAYTEGFISISRIVSSKVVLIYLSMLILLFHIYKKSKDRYVFFSTKAIILMIITKLTVFLGRFQYYAIPLLILGIDNYFYDKKRKGKILIYQLYYSICLFVISLVPLWSPSTFDSINDPILINANSKYIEKKISERCMTLNHYDPENEAIIRCK